MGSYWMNTIQSIEIFPVSGCTTSKMSHRWPEDSQAYMGYHKVMPLIFCICIWYPWSALWRHHLVSLTKPVCEVSLSTASAGLRPASKSVGLWSKQLFLLLGTSHFLSSRSTSQHSQYLETCCCTVGLESKTGTLPENGNKAVWIAFHPSYS